MKPADNAGSRGVVLLDEPRQAVDLLNSDGIPVECADQENVLEERKRRLHAYEKHLNEIMNLTYRYSRANSRNGTVMVEEYMQGPEVSVEVMVVEGEPHILAITDKYITPPPYFVELAHCEPSMLLPMWR